MDQSWTEAEVIHLPHPGPGDRRLRARRGPRRPRPQCRAALAARADRRRAGPDAVAWTSATEDAEPSATGQDKTGRPWDVLMMTCRVARQGGPQHRRAVQVLRVPVTGRGLRPRLTTLHLVTGRHPLERLQP